MNLFLLLQYDLHDTYRNSFQSNSRGLVSFDNTSMFLSCFPQYCGGFPHRSLSVFWKALLLASELPTFYERLSLWAWILRWRIFHLIVWRFRDSPSFVSLSFSLHREIHFHIIRTRGCVFPCKTMCIILAEFPLVKQIFWSLSVHLTILFLHPGSSNHHNSLYNNTSSDV